MKHNREIFIKNATDVHHNLYDYTFVEYKNADTKVFIVCKIHGGFMQTPYKHTKRKQGCPSCRGNRIAISKRMSNEEFIEKCRIIHGTRYEYPKLEYKNCHTKIEIICKKHGAFLQTPNNHLYSANGCPKCSSSISAASQKWLDSIGVQIREYKLPNLSYIVDGFDPENNVVYEYLGRFWHGDINTFNADDIHPITKLTFGEMYENTMNRIQKIENDGYEVIFIWGD